MGFLRRIAHCRGIRSMVLQGGSWSYGGANLTLNLTLISKEILTQTNCKLLDVRHNQLKDIPEGIARMPYLTALHADNNRIRHIPQALGSLFRLRALTFGSNDLFELPLDVFRDMSCLVSLDLSRNSLKDMPPSIALCTALTRVNLSHNQIHELPDTLSRLRNLRYLYVGYNPLRQLPPAIGASEWLSEVTADCCNELTDFTPPEVLNNTVPTRCPLADPQMGGDHLLCNAHRIVAMLAQPGVLDIYRWAVVLNAVWQNSENGY